MVDDNYIPKIIDWGSANDTDRKTGTPMYYAPEALDENKALDYLVLQKTDIWSAGIIIYYLFEQVHPLTEEQMNAAKEGKLLDFQAQFYKTPKDA